MPRYNIQPTPRPTPTDKLQKLQSFDSGEDPTNAMLKQLSVLYGIHQGEQQQGLESQRLQQQGEQFGQSHGLQERQYEDAHSLLPEHLRGLTEGNNLTHEQVLAAQTSLPYLSQQLKDDATGRALKNEGQTISNSGASAELPYRAPTAQAGLTGQIIQNEHGQTINRFLPETLQNQLNLGQATVGGENARTAGLLLQNNLVTPRQAQPIGVPASAMVGINKKYGEDEVARAAELAKMEHPFTDQLSNFGVPTEYQNDPQIAQMLSEANVSKQHEHDYYKKGGGLDTEIQRDKLKRKISPKMSILKDLFSLYQ